MRHVFRTLAIVIGVVLLNGAVTIVLIVIAGREGRLYSNRVELAFLAATTQYAAGEADNTVRATYDGKETELNPDKYRVLSYYMREGAVKAFWPHKLDGAHIAIVICATDRADIYRLSDDSAIVVFESSGKKMKMRIRGTGIWNDLVNAIE